MLAGVCVSCVGLVGCGKSGETKSDTSKPGTAEKRIVVGGKNYTEQYLLSEMARLLLEQAGFQVEMKTGVGSVIIRQSLEKGQVDFYFEYTGTAYTLYHKQNDPNILTDPVGIFNWVKEKDASKDLVWMERINFNNTYTLMVNKDFQVKHGLKSVSDLAAFAKKNPDALKVGLDAEFWERPDGFKKMMKVYDFSVPVKNVKRMEVGLTYMALQNKDLTVAMGFSTDGRISGFGLSNLEDDKQFFPVYNPAPVVRREVLDKYPELAEILRPLNSRLTTEVMQKLNAAIDVDKQSIELVASNWLREQGLLK
jgi:osmoprotectant transport system substrate-binding protein